MIELLLDIIVGVVGPFVEIPMAVIGLAVVIALAVIFPSVAGWITVAILCALFAWRHIRQRRSPADPDREPP